MQDPKGATRRRKTDAGRAGVEAREATGQVPARPIRDDVLRSEKNRRREDLEQPRGASRRRSGA